MYCLENVTKLSYCIKGLKRQKCLKVGTDKSKLKLKMRSVSDDNTWKRFLEKLHFELAMRGVLRLGRCLMFIQHYENASCR